MPKPIMTSRSIVVPDGVTLNVKSRVVDVSGPRGKLTKSFTHLDVDMYLVTSEEKQTVLKVDVWFGKKKTIAAVRTVCSHVANMIAGVTKGFRYTMRFVYAHFPINANIDGPGKNIEIRNFLGEKRVRRIEMLEDTKIARSDDVKDQLVLTMIGMLCQGNNIEAVSRTCALIHQSCLVKNKDIRKFLDGIYVESKGEIQAQD